MAWGSEVLRNRIASLKALDNASKLLLHLLWPKDESNSSAQHSDIKVVLNFPGFARSLQEVSLEELQEFLSKINQIQKMTWDQIYKTSTKNPRDNRGLNWEDVGQKTSDGRNICTIRMTKRHRARVCRDGIWIRFIDLHPTTIAPRRNLDRTAKVPGCKRTPLRQQFPV